MQPGHHGSNFDPQDRRDLFIGEVLDVHEDPRLTASSEQRLASGNVVTVEPGIYLPDRLGVRIEDLVVVTESGRDVLSHTSKELLTID